jgi:hypothetical protein
MSCAGHSQLMTSGPGLGSGSMKNEHMRIDHHLTRVVSKALEHAVILTDHIPARQHVHAARSPGSRQLRGARVG